MNIEIKNNNEKLETTLEITLNKEEFAPFLDSAFKKEVKNVKADGFRQGKMPKKVFIQKYGIEALFNEAINQAIANTYAKAITDNDIKGVAFPKIDVKDVSEEKLSFEAVVAVAPTIDFVDEEKINVEQPSLEVSEEEINSEIAKLLSSETELVVADKKAESGDTVVIDFKGFVDGEAFEGGEGHSYPLELGSNSFIPGFEEQLIGSEAGSEVKVSVKFPEGYQAENLSGKDAIFECLVHEVKIKEEPKLDEEFVQNLGIENVSNINELKENKKEELAKEKEKNHENILRDNTLKAIDAYAKELDINIHELHISEEINAIISNFEKQNQIEFSQYAKMVGKEEAEIKEEIKETAVDSIKRRTIMDFLLVKHDLEATDEDVKAEIQKLADMYQVDASVIEQSVASELSQIKSMIKDNKLLDKLSA